MRSWVAHKWLRLHFRFHLHIHPLFGSLVWLMLSLGTAYAGTIGWASLSLADPRPAQTAVDYAFSFTVPTNTVVRSLVAQFCTTNSGSCVTPSGFSGSGASLAAQPTGLGDSSGWVADPTVGSLRLRNSGNLTAPSGQQQVTFSGVTNPDTAGTYIVLIRTYADDNYSAQIDSTQIAVAYVTAVTVSLTVDSAISFAVTGMPPSTVYKGSLVTSDRCNNTSNTVNFGTPSLDLDFGVDYDCAQTLTTSTNGSSGYQVTVSGVVAGDDLMNDGDSSIAIDDWSGTNSAPTSTPGGAAELFAYTTSDSSLSGTPGRFTDDDNRFAGLSPFPEEVAFANVPVSNDTVNVGYRLRFTATSTGGTYSGRVIYTCTPVF